MKFGHRTAFALKILGLALAIATILMGFNEATRDILDQIGSNYWLAYSSILSGAAIIILIIFFPKRSAK